MVRSVDHRMLSVAHIREWHMDSGLTPDEGRKAIFIESNPNAYQPSRLQRDIIPASVTLDHDLRL